MSTTFKPLYGSSSSVAITLASLAASSSLLAGQESDAIDNSAALAQDYLIAGQVTTGTSPTAGTIEVHVVGKLDDANWPDAFDGTGSAETITDANVKAQSCRLVASITTGTTSNEAYPFGPLSVANCFGGTLPKAFVCFVTHSTVAALNSTGGNHFVSITPVNTQAI